ncbi:unnamed protein product [Durusdinium trenchii]|uniref:RNA-binding protein squid (Heterogeneous nuclear ribonucleoprotein 40) (HNRNP 40) n=2 Tax=Durusdinium trenchii TaxID=1381693 RepID=A0ABP0QPS7_9DINO
MPKKGVELGQAKAKGTKRKHAEDAEDGASQACKVYLQGIPRLCQVQSIKDRFSQYGEILDVEIPPMRRNKSKRIAFVSFVKASEAKAALEEDENDFEGSTLKVQLSRANAATEDAPASASSGTGAGTAAGSTASDAPEASIGTKVFVTGFGKDCTENDLTAHFSKCGKLESVSMPVSKSAKTKGSSRGFAILEFSKKKFAAQALKLSKKLKGQDLTIKPYTSSAADEKQQKKASAKKKAKAKEQTKHQYRVVVQGFPKAISEKNLREHFEPCGEIQEIKMPKKKDGELRGVAFISFASKEAMKEALRLDGEDFRDKPLKVVKSDPGKNAAGE